jgi:hypothetical protein
MAITLVVFVGGANLIVDEYSRGVLRTAVDEAARAGSQEGAAGGAQAACEAKAAEVMRNLLAGPIGKGVTISCALHGSTVVATAAGRLPGWLPPVPSWSVHATGVSQLERNPTPSS